MIDQSTIDSIINHVLQFARIGIKSNLLSHWQFLVLDNFPALVDVEGHQAKLLVFLHSPLHSLPLLVPEISFCHNNEIHRVEISSSHVDFVDRLVTPGVPKDVLMQK